MGSAGRGNRRPRGSGRRRRSTQERRQRVVELHEKFHDAVTHLVSTKEWCNMLRGALHLRRYSFRNMILILLQCPHASQVAGYGKWLEKGRQVRKGEEAIWILAPMPIRDTREDDEESSEKSDEGEKLRLLFKPVAVFDISQTDPCDGHDESHLRPQELPGPAPARMWEELAAFAEAQGYTVRRTDTGRADGTADPKTHTVAINERIGEAQAALALAHEVAHIVCGHVSDLEEYRQHRGRMETEAESVAYIVAAWFGLDSAVNSVAYVGGWAGETPEEVQATMQKTGDAVMSAARTILDAVAPEPSAEIAGAA